MSLATQIEASTTATPSSPTPTLLTDRWLHVCNGLDPVRDGGMVPSILGMTGALAELGPPITIVTATASRLGETSVPTGVRLLGPEVRFESAIERVELVHFHGLWQVHTRRGSRAARRGRVPYLIAAHGMTEPWALRHKAIKKKLYTALVEGRNLRHAACLHALTRPEVGHLRALAPRTPVCLVPNGVDLRPFESLHLAESLRDQMPILQGKHVLLFFSRVHSKKGLDLLAPALREVVADHPEIHLMMAGKDDGALSPFLAMMEAFGLRDRVTYLGHLGPDQARRAWATADSFVLPSHSEGFSMAILEALAARLPVLITRSCHFPELEQAGGGIVVDADLSGVTSGLRRLLETSDRERAEMAGRGRLLVQERYTWASQAHRLRSVYQWIVGGGPAPEAVTETGTHP